MALSDEAKFAQLTVSEHMTHFKDRIPAEMLITPSLLGHAARHGIKTLIIIDGYEFVVTGYDTLNRALIARRVVP